jgi:tetratricopeptide (TPR) repeat protein
MLLPLVFTPFTFFPWHFGKTVIFQIAVELLVLFFVVGTGHDLSLRRWLKSLNYLDWSILAFLTIISVSSLVGVNPENSFWGLQNRANGVFTWWHFGAYYFLLKYFFNGQLSVIPAQAGIHNRHNLDSRFRGNDKWIVAIAAVVAILASLTSLFPQILPTSWQSTAGGGIIGNRAFLAGYLVLATGLSTYCVTLFKNNWRWFFVASSALLTYTIYTTSNRGALLGLLAGIFIALVSSVFLVKRKMLKVVLSLVVLVFLSLGTYYLVLNTRSLTSGTGETRLMAWNIAWQGIKARPVIGWGWGNFDVVFDKFYNPNFLKYSFTETVWDKPHNWFLEIGVTGGLVSVLAYLAILISAGYYLLKNRNSILLATLLASFVTSLFLFETSNSLILWFLLLAITSTQRQAFVIPAQAGIQQTPSRRLDSLFQGNDKLVKSVVVLCALFVAYILFLNFRSLKYSYYMRQAELSTALMDWLSWSNKSLNAPVPFKYENAIFLSQQFVDFDKAVAMPDKKEIKDLALSLVSVLDQSMKQNPLSLSYPVWSGQVYTVLGDKFDKKYYTEAENVLKKAVEISPQKQEVRFLLSRLYLLQSDFAKALPEQRQAVEIAPQIASSHWFYGLALVASGDRSAGLTEIEKALELGYSITAEQKLYVLDLYTGEKNYPKLIEEYKKLIEAEPGNVNWYIKLATVYAVSGDKKSALDLAQYILLQAPQLKNEVDNFIKEYKLK